MRATKPKGSRYGMEPKPHVRLNGRNAESVRQKIKVIKLTKRLQNHALGEIEMKPTEIDAAKFLINKRMPNPPEKKELSGPNGGPIPGKLVIEFIGT